TEPEAGARPLVWAFFTERGGSKRQVHYLNDEALARDWGDDAHYRPIEYATSGAPGGPLGLHLALRDRDDRPVSWDLGFDPGARLDAGVGAGLTDQSGHRAADFFLLFYREKQAGTFDSRIRVGSDEFTFEPGTAPFPPAYSA